MSDGLKQAQGMAVIGAVEMKISDITASCAGLPPMLPVYARLDVQGLSSTLLFIGGEIGVQVFDGKVPYVVLPVSPKPFARYEDETMSYDEKVSVQRQRAEDLIS